MLVRGDVIWSEDLCCSIPPEVTLICLILVHSIINIGCPRTFSCPVFLILAVVGAKDPQVPRYFIEYKAPKPPIK